MGDWVTQTSPRFNARIAGVFYVMTGLAPYALVTRASLVVRGDAAATATNIMNAEQLFRIAFAADIIAVAAYIVVTAILYQLLKPVSRSLSMVAAFFGLAGCIISIVNMLNHLAPLIFLGGETYLSAIPTGELQTLAYASLKLHGFGFNLAMMFFGFYCFSIGLLIMGSTFLPRLIGLLMSIAGLSYLTYIFSFFVFPAFSVQLYPYILAPGVFGEGSLMLWLILVGVNASRWREQAGIESGVV